MRRPAGERGSATVEIAVLAPVLLFTVFTIIQIGLWSFARSLALGAAQEGVAAGRGYQAPAQAGQARAEEFLAAAGGDSLLSPRVVAHASSNEVTVEVTGRAQSVLPGVPGLPVRQRAQGPIERYTLP